MPEEPTTSRVPCPACGKPAEAGCIYGRDGGWVGLRWRAGEPSFSSNLATGFGGGEEIGDHLPFVGPYVKGTRCHYCNRIVLEF